MGGLFTRFRSSVKESDQDQHHKNHCRKQNVDYYTSRVRQIIQRRRDQRVCTASVQENARRWLFAAGHVKDVTSFSQSRVANQDELSKYPIMLVVKNRAVRCLNRFNRLQGTVVNQEI